MELENPKEGILTPISRSLVRAYSFRLKSLESLQDVEQGLAAVAALPDMFLANGETFAASGGAAVFGDEFGFGGTLAFRGNKNWSFGASAAIGGDEATGKVQVRWAR